MRSDLVAGFTIAVMGLPQGLANAKLANVPAVHGAWRPCPDQRVVLTGVALSPVHALRLHGH
jgi:MFS superfamily sulfate permease-like transporter